MRKNHTQKGITLIALIITIVVLLILAAVAIASIQNDGILSYAQNAAKDYNQAAKNEQDMLGQYLNYLNGNTGSSTGWVQTGLTVTNGSTTLYVGDYVNYTSGVEAADTIGWQVLGAEDGEILLISADILQDLTLSGIEGYNTIKNPTELNTQIKALVGQGKYATGARLIDVEDIDRITGYNPNSTGDGTKFLAGTINEYGKTFTYTITAEGKIAYTDGGSLTDTSSYEIFIHPDGRTLASDSAWNSLTDDEKAGLTRTTEPITVTNNAYIYNPETLTIDLDNVQPGAFAADNEAYKMLFGSNYATLEAAGVAGTKATSKYTGANPYWLASACEMGVEGGAVFGIFDVFGGLVDGYSRLWYSSDHEGSTTLGARPVVSLASGVTLTSAGAGSWNLPTN